MVRGFSAYFVTSSVAARFFPPQSAGAGATVGQSGFPFRIDHDEKFNETTHLQYTLSHASVLTGLWGGFNWRYDRGSLRAPCPATTPPAQIVLAVESPCRMANRESTSAASLPTKSSRLALSVTG